MLAILVLGDVAEDGDRLALFVHPDGLIGWR